MASYYRKFHTFTPPTDSIREALGLDWIDDQVQGKSGPIQASFPNMDNPLQKAWVDTFRTLNYHMTDDPLSGEGFGCFSNPCSIDPLTKERSHAGNSYYAPVAERANLHVVTEAYVEKILLEQKGNDFSRERCSIHLPRSATGRCSEKGNHSLHRGFPIVTDT